MSDKTQALLEMAGQCEASRGVDTLVDAAIWQALGNVLPTSFQVQYEGASVPRYTASLDAAMTLVPEGWLPEIDLTLAPASVTLWPTWSPPGNEQPMWEADAATGPLALCAAALRARAALASASPGAE